MVAENYSVRRRGRRFLVEVGGRRSEVAAPTIDLLVLRGVGEVSSDVLELASEEDVLIVFIGDGFFSWFAPPSKKDIGYVIGQWGARNILGDVFVDTYIDSSARFLESMGFDGNYVRIIGETYSDFWRSVEPRVETQLLVNVVEKTGLPLSFVEETYRLYLEFLEAEALNAVIRAGLSPHIDFLGKTLYSELALEFRAPLVWDTIRGFREPLPSRAESILKPFKSRVYGYVRVYGKNIYARKLIHSRAKGVARCSMNPGLRLRPLRWFR